MKINHNAPSNFAFPSTTRGNIPQQPLFIASVRHVDGNKRFINIPRPDYNISSQKVRVSAPVFPAPDYDTSTARGGASALVYPAPDYETSSPRGRASALVYPEPDYDTSSPRGGASALVYPEPDYDTSTARGSEPAPVYPEPDYKTSSKKVKFVDNLDLKSDVALDVGKKIGFGGCADVYENKSNPDEVLKLFKVKMSKEEVEHEVDCFCKCYGEGSASIIISNNEMLGIRMKKINGTPLANIDALPGKAKNKIESMIEDLESKGIFHCDLTETNILYNSDENKFYCIDITSCSVDLNGSNNSKSLLDAYWGWGRNYIIGYVNDIINFNVQ
ncbi:type III secretion system effector kinase NleH [Grimontia hollisae]|uniref:Tyrosine protein kinase n=1 Tax=Grimontia hollisae CIP 101886 TaxID=675812 RepID=D0I5W8_GRIHO|nr:type III secretion system effector kinase NleH [Grimontia hollisae]EEY73282.1 tyrosine protein kinase [Grimontia hollisae CIP 101886]STO76854.1 Uncharacterised protein [Grimontia hollisae]